MARKQREEKPHVLVVMNSRARREFLYYMEDCDVRRSFASTAEEARGILSRCSDVAAVIVDEELPEGDWEGVAEAAAKSASKATLLVCTKRLDQPDIETGSRKYDIPDVIVKPYDKEVVRERVMGAVAREPGSKHGGAGLPSHAGG